MTEISNNRADEEPKKIWEKNNESTAVIKKYYKNMKLITNNMGAFIYAIKKDYEIVYVNDKIKDFIGGVKPGTKCYEIFWNGKTSPCKKCPIKSSNKKGKEESKKFYNPTFNMWYEVSVAEMTHLDGDENYIVTCMDITKQKVFEEKLKKAAYEDRLLEIPNRNCFVKDLENYIGSGKEKGVLLIINLCNFKEFNDAFTHKYGDLLLKDVANYLNSICKKGKIYRYGGDRFIVDLIGYGIDKANEMVDEIFHRFSLGFKIKDIKYSSDINMGMVIYNDSFTMDKFITSLDHVIEEANKKGPKGFSIFDENLLNRVNRKNKIIEIMASSLQRGSGFQVYYQPIYNIEEEKYVKAEALLRLYEETIGSISPMEFIPIAEESGIINELGMFVIEKACEKLQHMKNEGWGLKSIAVNISTVQFSQENFVEKVKSLVEKYNISPGSLEFEITESVLIHSFEKVRSTMLELKEIGITFSLDDFGTGYSALSYLLNLPINCLKVDKSFIDQVEVNNKSLSMLKSIINLGYDLGMQIVAEGVETKDQYDILQGLKCHNIQGYYFSKPVSDKEFIKTIKSS